MPLEIRPAEPAELPDVADLCVAAYAPFLAGEGHYVAELRDVARRASEAELLVAVEPDRGEVLGTVTFVPDGGALGEIAGPREAEFRMLAVGPAAQGRGVGTALLRRVLDDSRRGGKERVVCSSLPVMRAAHRIYAHLGFERVPARDWSPVPGVELLAFAISFNRSTRSEHTCTSLAQAPAHRDAVRRGGDAAAGQSARQERERHHTLTSSKAQAAAVASAPPV